MTQEELNRRLADYSDERAWLEENKDKYTPEEYERLQEETYKKYFPYNEIIDLNDHSDQNQQRIMQELVILEGFLGWQAVIKVAATSAPNVMAFKDALNDLGNYLGLTDYKLGNFDDYDLAVQVQIVDYINQAMDYKFDDYQACNPDEFVDLDSTATYEKLLDQWKQGYLKGGH